MDIEIAQSKPPTITLNGEVTSAKGAGAEHSLWLRGPFGVEDVDYLEAVLGMVVRQLRRRLAKAAASAAQ